MNIEQMAREAGFDPDNDDEDRLPFHGYAMNHFAALVRAQVLDEAAAACRARVMGDHNREDQEAKRCADAILALKEKQ